MSLFLEVTKILDEVLQLGGKTNGFDMDTALLGRIPEFDSMAVVTVITAIEEQYGIVVDDDEVDAETFETVGSLTAFIENKL